MNSRSVADIIIEHIEPMVNDDIVTIETNLDEVIRRYIMFKERHDIDTVEIYNMLVKLYAKEIKVHERKLGISYRLWSNEVMRKFENEFSNKYIAPFTNR